MCPGSKIRFTPGRTGLKRGDRGEAFVPVFPLHCFCMSTGMGREVERSGRFVCFS